jgi:hypothetical protein
MPRHAPVARLVPVALGRKQKTTATEGVDMADEERNEEQQQQEEGTEQEEPTGQEEGGGGGLGSAAKGAAAGAAAGAAIGAAASAGHQMLKARDEGKSEGADASEQAENSEGEDKRSDS